MKIILTLEDGDNIKDTWFVEIEERPYAGQLFGILKNLMQLFSGLLYMSSKK